NNVDRFVQLRPSVSVPFRLGDPLLCVLDICCDRIEVNLRKSPGRSAQSDGRLVPDKIALNGHPFRQPAKISSIRLARKCQYGEQALAIGLTKMESVRQVVFDEGQPEELVNQGL